MANAFEVLGLKLDADSREVRDAYRMKVKACHPDQFSDEQMQRVAQEQLIELNLAYEEALRFASERKCVSNTLPASEAMRFALRLMEQGKPESALRQLCRADAKDSEWYYLQGQLLMAMRQYDTAHQSYREAVRREPDNTKFRQGALTAALAVKKHRQLPYRFSDWVKDTLRRK